MKISLLNLLVLIILFACSPKDSADLKTWKEEVMMTEKRFSDMSIEKGIKPAFLEFAAENAVINRNDTLIIGIEKIRQRFEALPAVQGQLSWSPEFVHVSRSGDLAYTYGYYTFLMKDSAGSEVSRKGVFHTVWQRQADGSWKYVWD
jgi:ketosteroid isomerase-like protein